MKKFAEFWKHDWPMKLVAIGIAALLWFFVIAQENPVRVKEFENIPVTYKGVEQLEDNGLCLSEGIDGVLEYVSVSVEASMDVLQYLTAEDITATLDFSDITVAGDYTLKIKAKSETGNISSVSPDTVKVKIENLVTHELPVEVQVIGADNESLYYGKVQTNVDLVSVSGTQTEMDNFTKAVVVVDATNAKSTITESKTVALLTEDGKLISADEYDRPLPSVIINMPIYPTVIVPVDIEEIKANISGPAEGYEITDISLSQNSVRVAAPPEILKDISDLEFSKINVKDAKYNTTVQIYPVLPTGAVAVIPDQLMVTIEISEIREKKDFQSLPLEFRNLESGYKCESDPETVNVTVSGSEEDLLKVHEKDIHPYLDLSGLGVGTHEVVILFEQIVGLDLEFDAGIINAAVQIVRE